MTPSDSDYMTNSYSFTGVIYGMSQHKKKTKAVGEPHTSFKVAVQPVEQNIFEKMIEEIALNGHHAIITIKTMKAKPKPESKSGPKHLRYGMQGRNS